MSNQQSAIEIIKALSGQTNILTIPRLYINFMGSVEGGLLLSQILYWSDKGKKKNGWFYKTYREWQEEIALSQYQVSKSAKKMVKMGFLETKRARANGSPTVHYRLNYDRFSYSIIEFLTMEHQETSQSLTETTPETTTDINTPPSRNSNNNPQADPLSDLLKYQTPGVSEETGPNPDDQWWGSRDAILKLHARFNGGHPPGEAQKTCLVELAGKSDFSPTVLEASYLEAGKHQNPKYGKYPTLARVIEIYTHGGDYEKFAAWKWPKESESTNVTSEVTDEERRAIRKLDLETYG